MTLPRHQPPPRHWVFSWSPNGRRLRLSRYVVYSGVQQRLTPLTKKEVSNDGTYLPPPDLRQQLHIRGFTPPHDVEAEESVIGSLLIDGESLEKVHNDLSPQDFYTEKKPPLLQGGAIDL